MREITSTLSPQEVVSTSAWKMQLTGATQGFQRRPHPAFQQPRTSAETYPPCTFNPCLVPHSAYLTDCVEPSAEPRKGNCCSLCLDDPHIPPPGSHRIFPLTSFGSLLTSHTIEAFHSPLLHSHSPSQQPPPKYIGLFILPYFAP